MERPAVTCWANLKLIQWTQLELRFDSTDIKLNLMLVT